MNKIRTKYCGLSNRDKKIALLIATLLGAIVLTLIFKLGEAAGSELYNLGYTI